MRNESEPGRILLMRLGGFGDVVFTVPAVDLVRKAFPNSRITFLVYKEFAPLLEGFRGVDAVITLDRAEYRRLNPISLLTETSGLLAGLLRNRFKLVVDFQGFGETGLLTWLSRAPERWGSVYRPSRRWAYTRPIARNRQLHPIEYHLDLLRQGGGLDSDVVRNEFVLPETVLQEARRFFSDRNLHPNRTTLFLQPFTSSPHKEWPLTHYLAMARYWQERGLQVLFGGGPGEKAALESARRDGFVVAAGAPVLLSAGLVKLSHVVIGGDTGLLHLAVAMGKRVIMLMKSGQPGACYPFGQRDSVILPPEGFPVAAITAEAVNEACAQALAEPGVLHREHSSSH